MKKLLSILAAVGLTATAGASVVACGNKTSPEAKPQIAELLKGKLELGKVKTDAEALIKAKAVIADIPQLEGHVQFSTPVHGQIKVTPADNTLSGEAFFTYQLEWTVIQADISNIKINNIYVGMSFAKYHQIIQTAIDQLVWGTQINHDYTIEGSTSHGGKNKITVAAISDSELIQGQFKIDILMIEMDNTTITIGDSGMVQRTIENYDQLGNVQVYLKMDDEKADTFSKVEVINKQMRFTVDQTEDIIEVFTGIITITANHVEPVKIAVQIIKHDPRDIADLLAGKLKLGYVIDEDQATAKAEEVIKEIPELKGHVELSDPTGGKIQVTPIDDTLTGSADFSYGFNVNDLLKDKLDLGKVSSAKTALSLATSAVNKIWQLAHKMILDPAIDGKIHVTVKPNYEYITGEDDFTYTLKSTDIADLLKDKLDLGYVADTNEATDKAQVVIAIADLKDKVILDEPSNGLIHVTADDPDLTGSADFKYQLKKDLSEVIPVDSLALGWVANEQDATDKVKGVLEGLKLIEKVSVADPNDNKIVVTATDSSLKGSVTFTYDLQQDLSKVIPVDSLALGWVANEQDATDKVKGVLEGLKLIEKVSVAAPNDNKIVVTATDSSLKGSVTFTYDLQQDLSKVIPVDSLALGWVANEQDATDKVKGVLEGLKLIEKVSVAAPSDNKIVVTATDSSLKGSVTFTYDLQQDLSKVIPVDSLALGWVANEQDATDKVKGVLEGLKLIEKVSVAAPSDNKIVVTATDSSLKGSVTFTYSVKKTINLEKDSATIYPDDVITIKINNLSELTNATVTVSEEEQKYATASLEGDIITITGHNEGTAKVLVQAEHANDRTINISVGGPRVEIEVEQKSAIVAATKTTSLKIENFKSLVNPKPTPGDSKIATATIDETGNVNITGVKKGVTKITLDADNTIKPVEISVDVKPNNVSIEISDRAQALLNIETFIQIDNYDDLINLEVTSNKPDVVSAEIDSGSKAIKLFGKITGPYVSINVTADNAAGPETIQVTVQPAAKGIDLGDLDPTQEIVLTGEEPYTFQIKNIERLYKFSAYCTYNSNKKISVEVTVNYETGEVTLTKTKDAINDEVVTLKISSAYTTPVIQIPVRTV